VQSSFQGLSISIVIARSWRLTSGSAFSSTEHQEEPSTGL